MRRTARFLTFLLFLGAWLAFGYWAAFGRSGGIPDTQLKCPDCDAIEVTRIIDGDTFDSSIGRVRLFGMDTPERGEHCFGEATERLAELAGDLVRIEPGPRLRDPYDRHLFYIYTDSGHSIDEILVMEGLAVAW
jgi:endonuclease YncB( thermonuclease family)